MPSLLRRTARNIVNHLLDKEPPEEGDTDFQVKQNEAGAWCILGNKTGHCYDDKSKSEAEARHRAEDFRHFRRERKMGAYSTF